MRSSLALVVLSAALTPSICSSSSPHAPQIAGRASARRPELAGAAAAAAAATGLGTLMQLTTNGTLSTPLGALEGTQAEAGVLRFVVRYATAARWKPPVVQSSVHFL